jgi:hypothetical protein
MRKITTTTLNSRRVHLTLALMVTLLILTTSVPSFAQQIYMRTDVVAPHGTNVYHWTFVGRELEVLGLSGDGDTDLDLYVYDENGYLVAKDDDFSDDCLVRFTPRWTGSFTIRVVNRGPYANKYTIGTN